MIEHRYIERWTRWSRNGQVEQVALALLDDDWEPLAEVTERVGPFDDAVVLEAGVRAVALGLARRQLAGQQELLPDL